MKLISTLFGAAVVALTVSANPASLSAQGMNMPAAGTRAPASPRDSVKASVGGATVAVNYGRPSKRNRVVFGGLPDMKWGMTWRMGANEATTLTTTKTLQFDDVTVPPGSYTLRVKLEEDGKWELIINRQTGQWGTEYKPDMDVGRVEMTVTETPSLVETMQITVMSTAKGGELAVAWDRTKATAAFTVK